MTPPHQKALATVKGKVPADATLVRGVPEGFPEPDIPRSLGGKIPEAVYHYRNANGDLAFLIARLQTEDGNKKFISFSLWEGADGGHAWYMKAFDVPRPLYNLPEVSANPDRIVVISEGEKCADKVATFQTFVSVTWSNGSNSVAKTDWTPLADRDVVILPDLDEPGAKAANMLVSKLKEAGARSVKVADMQALAQSCGFEVKRGFDIADAIDQGLDEPRFHEILADPEVLGPEQMTIESTSDPRAAEETENSFWVEPLKKFGVGADSIEEPFWVTSDGVMKGDENRRGDPVTVQAAGSPLLVLGRTLSENEGWGYLLAIHTPKGQWETLALPARLLGGDGRELRERLAAHGVIVPQDRAGRQALAEYIGYARQKPIMRVATRPGWHGNSFALPQDNIHAEGEASDLITDLSNGGHFLKQSGTMEGWKDLAALAEGNSRACFLLSVAFAAPLLSFLGRQGCGFHLFGSGSRGKTTLLTLAGSAWGGGGKDGFVRSWRMTDNGAEALLVDHSDILLPLDEMTHASPELVSQINYLIGNGQGKARANRDGSGRGVAQMRAMVVSSGEKAAAAQVESGRSQLRMTGGQAVRMIDIPIQCAGEDAFEDLHGFESTGALVEAISARAKEHYGHAGPAFVKAIINNRAAVEKEVDEMSSLMIAEFVQEGDDPQVRRVVRQFALVAASAVLASNAHIVSWSREAIVSAVLKCCAAWKNERGGGESQENIRAERDLKACFETYGRTHFEEINGGDDTLEGNVPTRVERHAVSQRWGYFEERPDSDEGPIFSIFPEAFRRFVCGDHPPERMIKIALEHNALICDQESSGTNRYQKTKRLPEFPKGKKVYVIVPSRLP